MKKILQCMSCLWLFQARFASAVELIATYPSDATAFTQGLEYHTEKGLLLSTGLYGESSIGYLNLETGEREQVQSLEARYFGEGITVMPDGIWQLSWKEQTAFLRDVETLEVLQTAHYVGEGWGIAYDDSRSVLWLSNGSSKLQQYHPQTFAKLESLSVTENGKPVEKLNELEYANGFLYANIWQTNRIVKIDLETGAVVASFDLSEWVEPLQLTNPNDVLNGIAHIEGERFYITGKRYPVIWEMDLSK
ncbi:MAG: glutaminyl-peptide cyclotransferase [Aerococcaceae bacterium]|nr:glutaminyl-peptide cyclotransferase [Aerococcaceae bacterium]